MRTLTILGLAVVALALASAAQAQVVQQTATSTLEVKPLETGVAHGSVTVLPGRLTYTSDAISPYTSLSGIPVYYRVVEVPAWATVVVSPSHDVIPVDAPPHGVTWTAARSLQLQVLLSPDAPAGAVGQVTVEAITDGSGLAGETQVRSTFALPVASEEACHHPEAAQPTTDDAADVTLQSAATSPATATPIAAIGVGAVAALGVALYARKRSA